MNFEVSKIENFVSDYINAWSTEDDATRELLVNKVYAKDADFYADEPGDGPVERHGAQEILANITQVNVRLVQGMKLATISTGYSINHDALKVTWAMKSPQGETIMTGMNLLLLNNSGQILRDYIFIG